MHAETSRRPLITLHPDLKIYFKVPDVNRDDLVRACNTPRCWELAGGVLDAYGDATLVNEVSLDTVVNHAKSSNTLLIIEGTMHTSLTSHRQKHLCGMLANWLLAKGMGLDPVTWLLCPDQPKAQNIAWFKYLLQSDGCDHRLMAAWHDQKYTTIEATVPALAQLEITW